MIYFVAAACKLSHPEKEFFPPKKTAIPGLSLNLNTTYSQKIAKMTNAGMAQKILKKLTNISAIVLRHRTQVCERCDISVCLCHVRFISRGLQNNELSYIYISNFELDFKIEVTSKLDSNYAFVSAKVINYIKRVKCPRVSQEAT